MKAHACYHCKQWVEEGEAHDCWTTTEAALTAELSEELRDAWERLREAAVGLGEQRVYASHNSIMFARTTCYFFVRPKRTHLELNVFLGRAVAHPLVRKVVDASKTRKVHIVRIVHRDQVEAPLTDWLAEAHAGNTNNTKKGGTKGTKKSDTKGTKKGSAKGTKKGGTKGTGRPRAAKKGAGRVRR